MKKWAVLVLSAALLSACASSGNSALKNLSVESAREQITEGKTSKAEVQSRFGSPDNVTFTDNGKEIWTYRYVETTSHASNFIPVVSIFSSGQDVKTKEMIVMFNERDVVQRFTIRESNSTEKAGILGK